MFAGPNGSGKSTLIKILKEKIDFKIYLNADDIQEEINLKHYIDLQNYSLQLTNNNWLKYILSGPGILAKISDDLSKSVKIEDNILVVQSNEPLSYIAACIVDFLRLMLAQQKQTFSFETVMSHPSKINFIKHLKKKGYRTYLYYIATESADINIERIKTRVQKGGHDVELQKIKERYQKSLSLLLPAIKASDRAYIFDNSGTSMEWIAEITSGKTINIKTEYLPSWFNDNIIKKLN